MCFYYRRVTKKVLWLGIHWHPDLIFLQWTSELTTFLLLQLCNSKISGLGLMNKTCPPLSPFFSLYQFLMASIPLLKSDFIFTSYFEAFLQDSRHLMFHMEKLSAPNLQDHVSIFMYLGDRMSQLYP